MRAEEKMAEEGNKVLKVEILQGEIVHYLRDEATTGEMTLVYGGINPWRLFVEAVYESGDRVCVIETQSFELANEAASIIAKEHQVAIVDRTEIVLQ